jgi:RNA polymerase sigma-70 factor (ECF subfamily)
MGAPKSSTWLLGIARFKALSSIRKKEDWIDDDDAAQIADGADTPEVVTMKEDRAPRCGASSRPCRKNTEQ